MLENQLIRFTAQPTDSGCAGAIPYADNGAKFFLQSSEQGTSNYQVVDPSTLERMTGFYINDWNESVVGDYIHVALGAMSSPWSIRNGMCFRIRREVTSTINKEQKTIDISGTHYGKYVSLIDYFSSGRAKLGKCSVNYRLSMLGSNIRGTIYVTNHDTREDVAESTASAGTLTFDDADGSVYDIVFVPTHKRVATRWVELESGEEVNIGTGSFQYSVTFTYSEERQYSNVLMYHSNMDGLADVEYSCNKQAFGIPFDGTHKVLVTLPIIISNPQYKQADEVYETLDGKNIILYSEAAKEYELQTEYIPEEWHERILFALMCDDVLINGKDVYKSSEYSIDWEKYTETDCGTKLVRATGKVKENVVHRNSN